MTEPRWRCFVAVPLPEDLRTAVAAWVARWRDDPSAEAFRIIPADRWHLTLAFLGDIDPGSVAEAEAAVRDVAERVRPIPIVAAGRGAFPSAERARVVWCGVGDPSGRLATLAAEVRSGLDVPADEPFTPHVTVGRVRRRPGDVRAALQQFAPMAAAAAEVDRVDLLRSHLGPQPRYEVLAAAPLLAPARA